MFANIPLFNTIKKWDHDLLINHTWLWTIRLPWLMLYLAGTAILLGIMAVFPLKLYYARHFFAGMFVLHLLEGILFILWGRHFNQFLPEKALEHTTPAKGITEILTYILIVFIFLAPAIGSSYILSARFAQMVPYPELEQDWEIFSEWPDIYPKDIVEKYTSLDYNTYLSLQSDAEEFQRIEWQMQNTNDMLDLFHFGVSDMLLDIGFVASHLSIFLFVFRHTGKEVLGKAISAGTILIMTTILISGITNNYPEAPLNYFTTKYPTTEDLVFFILLVAISLTNLALALRVFWQKRYRTITAINIIILPAIIYYWVLVLTIEYISDFQIVEKYFGTSGILPKILGNSMIWNLGFFFFGTPIAILLIFPLVKAMYTRLLVLPKG